MKRYRSPDGERRIWFEEDEIEGIMQDELRKARLLPTVASPVVDLESFTERYLKANLDQYAELDDDVLGLSEFVLGERPQVRINRVLTIAACDEVPSPGILGRWRATVAHEASHVVLHRTLFELSEFQSSLIPDEELTPPRLLRCFKRDISFTRASGDWREVQANRGMAALLMPGQVFTAVTAEEMAAMHVPSVEAGTEAARQLAGRVATRFQVSREAASIRLGTLGYLRNPGQTALPII